MYVSLCICFLIFWLAAGTPFLFIIVVTYQNDIVAYFYSSYLSGLFSLISFSVIPFFFVFEDNRPDLTKAALDGLARALIAGEFYLLLSLLIMSTGSWMKHSN